MLGGYVLKRKAALIGRRGYRALALESSCDDSCIALLEKLPGEVPRVIDQEKKTLNSVAFGGIVPTEAHNFHQSHIANLTSDFCRRNGITPSNPPDILCCTRGPGMTGSVSAGLQFAKGLSLGWNRPLVGVHHMLGHILVAKLSKSEQKHIPEPKYPFLSLLCSGGHTLLVLLRSIIDHQILADTQDIAVGDAIDKCAREIGFRGNMIGKELEKFVDSIPSDLKESFQNIRTNNSDNKFKFQLALPLRGPKHKKIPDTVTFSFTSFLSSLRAYKEKHFKGLEIDLLTKQFLAYKIQEVIFDHILDRINICLLKYGNNKKLYDQASGETIGIKDFVCSGGVASNRRLRQKLCADLNSKSLRSDGQNEKLTFHFPDISLCTDNAVMIGVAGMEIFEQLEVKSDLSVVPIRKWPLNEIMSTGDWIELQEEEFKRIMAVKGTDDI